jgi:hypothetical protein
MPSILRIEGDPVSWIVPDAEIEGVAQQLAQSGGPVTLQVVAPLRGRLVLSAQSAGSVALLAQPKVVGWIPSYFRVASAHLYVPSATGPTVDFPGYSLAQSADLDTLQQDVVAAMSDGSSIRVQVSDGIESGVLVLNGAALSFAVFCPPTPGA